MKTHYSDFAFSNQGLDRRGFLKGVGATGVLMLTANWSWSQDSSERKYGGDAMPGGTKADPKVFIAIHEDGTIDITCVRSEMGQGIRTSLALVVADELEADWESCRVVQAVGDEDVYGSQNTDGSRSMRHWFMPMRHCGAAARTMLEQAAAEQWKVSVSEVKASAHKVIHAKSGRSIGYGALAGKMAAQAVPEASSVKLKQDKAFRYIGKSQTLSIDGADMVSGQATYGADVRSDGMVYAVVARPPVFGSKMESLDDGGALKVAGVLKVIPIEGAVAPSGFNPLGGVAVVAENTWAAIKGRDALKIQWSSAANDSYDSKAYHRSLEEASLKPAKCFAKRAISTRPIPRRTRSMPQRITCLTSRTLRWSRRWRPLF